jgi:hypothetical protein
LIDHILFNMPIWIHCDMGTISRIFHHWATPTFDGQSVDCLPASLSSLLRHLKFPAL